MVTISYNPSTFNLQMWSYVSYTWITELQLSGTNRVSFFYILWNFILIWFSQISSITQELLLVNCLLLPSEFAINLKAGNKDKNVDMVVFSDSKHSWTTFWMSSNCKTKIKSSCHALIIDKAITCSKLIIETLEQCVKYVQS